MRAESLASPTSGNRLLCELCQRDQLRFALIRKYVPRAERDDGQEVADQPRFALIKGAFLSAWCIEILWLLLVAILHAVPWLADGYVWCTWLAIAGALQLGMRGGWTASWWATWGWSTLALAIAFHWSPGVMAYTIDSSYALGLIVAFPLIAWDGLRLGLGYWLAVRLTRDPRNVWISGAITTILLEYLMPGVFSWKLGYTQLAWPWIVQAVDIFGPSFSTLVAFAFAGVLLQAARAKQLRKLFRRSEGRAAIASPHASPQLPAHASRLHTGTFLRNAWRSNGSNALLLVDRKSVV